MRRIRAGGGISKDHALDAERSSRGATYLQTRRVPGGGGRTASQLREGSYRRDLGTRPADEALALFIRSAACRRNSLLYRLPFCRSTLRSRTQLRRCLKKRGRTLRNCSHEQLS